MVTRYRRCYGPDCETQISEKLAFCRKHWYTLPKMWRDAIWASLHKYGAGTVGHMETLKEAAAWLEENAS
jgi:hypothetical protein